MFAHQLEQAVRSEKGVAIIHVQVNPADADVGIRGQMPRNIERAEAACPVIIVPKASRSFTSASKNLKRGFLSAVASSASTRWLPMKPAAPVTKYVECIASASAHENLSARICLFDSHRRHNLFALESCCKSGGYGVKSSRFTIINKETV